MSAREFLKNLGRHTWFEIDLDRIAANFRDMRKIVGDTIKIAAVLKADAYGHGAARVSDVVLEAGADMLAVATLDEAILLRVRHPGARVLVMGHTPPEAAPLAVRHGVRPTLFDFETAKAFSDAALAAKRYPLPVHLKIDTGMNRLGMKPSGTRGRFAEIAQLASRIGSLPGLSIEGTFTHLALRDGDSDRAQFAKFESVLDAFLAAGVDPGLRHVCDSIGTVRYPEFRLDMVRVGAALFGVRPFRMGPEYDAYPFPLAARFATRIARIRSLEEGEMVSYDSSWKAPAGGTRVATLPVGYADGYPRRFGNHAFVEIRGRRAPVVGLVCMDQTMVDVGSIPDAAEGDEVTLLGSSAPGAGISILEAAEWGNTNRNELLCGIGRRVPRVYTTLNREPEVVSYSDGGTHV